MANSVDPDQMLHFAASDLDLHCLFRPAVPILREIWYLFFHAKQTLILNDNINVKDHGSTYHSGASDGEACLLISCYDWVWLLSVGPWDWAAWSPWSSGGRGLSSSWWINILQENGTCQKWRLHIQKKSTINPCPTEPGYILPIQCRSRSVDFFRSQLIWICTFCHSVCDYVSTTWIK